MVALVARRSRRRSSTGRTAGSTLAETHEAASYWAGPLLNNLGWEYYEAGDVDLALDAFERALRRASGIRATATALALARYAVGQGVARARPVGRGASRCSSTRSSGPSAPVLPTAGSTRSSRRSTQRSAARTTPATQARLAIPLLETADPSFARDADRTARLRGLADAVDRTSLERDVPVLALRRGLALRERRLERGDRAPGASAAAGSRRRRSRAPPPCTGSRSAPCTRRSAPRGARRDPPPPRARCGTRC